MGCTAQVNQLAKIGVHCHEYSAFGGRPIQEGQIARISAQLASFYDVVPLASQPFRQTATDASVNQKSHRLAIDTAESESSAMTAHA